MGNLSDKLDLTGDSQQNQATTGNQGGGSGEGDNQNNVATQTKPEGDGQTGGDNNNQTGNSGDGTSTATYEEGSTIETPDGIFTVDKDGNFVDAEGKIFKEAKDVSDYVKQFDDANDVVDAANLQAIQALVGLDVTDENGNPMEFTDDDAGKKAYIEAVLKSKQKEATDIALDTYFTNNPLIKQFADYVQLGGNPADFGKIPDRTTVEFDPNNTEQHKQIIATAWKEDGRKGDLEGYIKYLEAGGSLADVAKSELEGLKQKDAELKKQIAEDAKKQREADIAEHNAYLQTVYERINGGVIGEYKIPESIVVEVNGQKLNKTRSDFYNYITRVDANGQTGYQKDLNSMSDSDYLNRELLDAWMHFSGGSYKTIVDMAVKANEVNRIKLIAKKAANNSTKTIKVTPKTNTGEKLSNKVVF